LTKSAVARPKRRRTTARRKNKSAAARPKLWRTITRQHQEEFTTATAGHDAVQPAEAGPDSTLIANPLPHYDTTALADMSTGMSGDMADEATTSGSTDPETHEERSPVLELVDPQPVDGAFAADDADDPNAAVEPVQPHDAATGSDDADDPDAAVEPAPPHDAATGYDEADNSNAAVEPAQPHDAATGFDEADDPDTAVEPAPPHDAATGFDDADHPDAAVDLQQIGPATGIDNVDRPDAGVEPAQPHDAATGADDAEKPDTADDLQSFDGVTVTDDAEGPEAAVEPGQQVEAATGSDDVEGAYSAVEPAQAVFAHIDAASSPDIQSAETARTLLDIMAMPSGAVQPQERALAGDTLLRLVSRMPVASLISLCDRLCIMEAPPPLLVRRLIHHENVDVAGPLLERCPGISDQDLMTLINAGDVATLRLIARRRHLSPALTDALIGHGDASVLLSVVRNPGASLSPEAFQVLAESAKSRTSLQAPLATRPDTPAPIAFELFWSLPPQLRRYVLSRFLTESATLDRILKIAHALEESNGSESAPSSKTVDKADIDELVDLMAQGKTTEAAPSSPHWRA
jgi:hypothetical protein